MKGILFCALAALTGGVCSGAQAQTASGVDWSGFYAGGLIGATDSRSDVSMLVGTPKYLDATDARQIARSGTHQLDQSGVSGGLFVGYGKQFGNVLVGIEGSANSLSLSKEYVTTEAYETVPSAQMTRKKAVSADWMAGLRLRLGWAQHNWLTYVTAGIAATRLQLNSTLSDNAFSGYSHASKSDWVTGASLGFGGEYALNRNWSLRGEYLYTKFGSVSTESEVTSTNNSGGTLVHKADLDIHGIFMGATYRF
ncbi:outer membrane protein [Ferribacterium limneticum]|uniref:outer membrane protein n=1 Tax=Ferribacterium limneticum TaxID=76259 RepID=UPI001CF9C15D|nr:outer membrane beta-barrel protein [Ferribacterium limneticum]UCV30179.1 porin family protein [Ferribacterium limneticum]UCV34098.1 porin family protein [Ferribacterium limneticum]